MAGLASTIALAAVITNSSSSTTDTAGLVQISTAQSQSSSAETSSSAKTNAVAAQNGARTIQVVRNAMKARETRYIGGVQTHFAYAKSANYQVERTAKLVNELGFNSFRDDVYWNAFAPNWDLSGAHLPKELTEFWDKVSAKPLMIVNNGNAYIPGASPPVTEGGRAAFGSFAQRVANVTSHKSAMFEIWNEWNMNAVLGRERLKGAGGANDPRASVNYAPLAVTASKSIRDKNPKATILIAASGDDEGWEWTKDVIRRGGLQYASGLSVHMYNHCTAPQLRNATEFADRLDNLRSEMVKLPGGEKPLYITEWGWPTGTNVCSVSEKNLADNVGQFLIYTAGTPWIAGTWYYELKDSGKNRADIQDNFGLYAYDVGAKSAACTARESMALINSAEAMEVERPYPNVFVAKIRVIWGTQIVAWTTSSNHSGSITIGGKFDFSARPMCGNKIPTSATRTIALGPTPTVVSIVSKDNFPITVSK